MTLGVFCHELGHMLFDLPDLYDTDDDSEGLGNWSLMAGGSWNGPNGLGGSPAFPDAYSHIRMGYVTPMVVDTNSINISIPAKESSATVYKLWKYAQSGAQYFLVENRQQTGYDSYLPGNGLLIYHVETASGNQNNQWYPGHTSYGHYLVALEQADGDYDLEQNLNRGDSGDPYPGSTDNRIFDENSVPDSKDYNGNTTFVEVINISNSSSNMTATLKVGTIIASVDQKRSDNTSHGSVGRWENNSFEEYPVPKNDLKFNVGTDEILKATREVLSNPTEKYHDWGVDNITNHHIFPIDEQSTTFIAYLKDQLSEATIENYLFSAGGANPGGDSIDFKDPWLIDFNDPPYGMRNRGMVAPLKTYPSPLNLTLSSDFKGVFLDQPFTGNNPHYTVRARQQQTIPFHGEDITWYFQGWSGTGVQFEHPDQTETAVVFKQADAVAQAQYKGHLASSSIKVVRYNNQRKIVYDGSLYHLVYEDHGNIYYTYSDDGITWEKETKLNTGNGGYFFPSIIEWKTISPEQSEIVVVWQDYYGSIYLRFNRDGNWHNQQSLNNFTPDTYFEATPVVAYASSEDFYDYFIVWRNYDYFPGEGGLKIVTYNSTTHNFGEISDVENTVVDSRFPSLEADIYDKLHLAWS